MLRLQHFHHIRRHPSTITILIAERSLSKVLVQRVVIHVSVATLLSVHWKLPYTGFASHKHSYAQVFCFRFWELCLMHSSLWSLGLAAPRRKLLNRYAHHRLALCRLACLYMAPSECRATHLTIDAHMPHLSAPGPSNTKADFLKCMVSCSIND